MLGRDFLRNLVNRLFITACLLATVAAITALVFILWSLVVQGIGGIDLDVFTKDTPPPGSEGGLLNAMVGSLMMCAMAMAIAIIVGILAGTWLAEYGGHTRYGAVVRFLNDVLLSAPSILVGLFVYELLVRPFEGFSGYAGAVALAFLATPIVTRTTEDILNLQSHALREAGIALGTPKWLVTRKIIWRAAGAGLLTGRPARLRAHQRRDRAPALHRAQQPVLQRGHDQADGEPSPLSSSSLRSPPSAYDDWRRLAWAGALIIAVVVLSINIIVRFIAREKKHA
jgi:phosphate transport system permease protein